MRVTIEKVDNGFILTGQNMHRVVLEGDHLWAELQHFFGMAKPKIIEMAGSYHQEGIPDE